MQKETIIVIDLKGSKGLVLLVGALTVMLLVLFVALPAEDGVVTASDMSVTQSTGMRQFYLTQSSFNKGSDASTACAPGYHMASLWEIADPSNLKYNTSLGYTRADSGQGASVACEGWVRTGCSSHTVDTKGCANCSSWSSVSGEHYGTTVELPSVWTAGDEDMGVWVVDTDTCGSDNYVWCIED